MLTFSKLIIGSSLLLLPALALGQQVDWNTDIKNRPAFVLTVAGTNGQIQFNSGGTNLGADANLFWDNTNKRLGIGQSTPLVNFHLKSTGTGGFPQFQLENGAAGGNNWYFGGTDNGNGIGGGFFIISPGTTSSAGAFRIDQNKNIAFQSLLTTYNAIATVSNGVPAEYAKVDLTGQGAAITATTLYAVPATGAGMYQISWVAKVTQAATTSSVLGGTNGFQIVYTDADDSVVTTAPIGSMIFTNNGNTTTTVIQGTITVSAKASTNIQYKMDYTSVGGTPMQYNLHVKLAAL